jgi:DNA-directed RNA polymerase subunit alpha
LIDLDNVRVDVLEVAADGKYGKVIIGPLGPGFGITLGNSLRRVLLSSLPGVAVTSVKIEGVSHEFSTISGIKEDVAEIILNIKGIRFKFYGSAPKVLYLEAHSKGELTAGMIKYDPEVDILNPDLHIATLSDDATISMELVVNEGIGYLPAEKNKQRVCQEIGSIAIDSIFTPVCRVNYFVENTRVGQVTDYDKLVLELWVDGSIQINEAVSNAAKILMDHLNLLVGISESGSSCSGASVLLSEKDKVQNLTLEEMELSVRAFNCLKRVGINCLRDLLKVKEENFFKIKNLGKKSMDEVFEKVHALGFDMFVCEDAHDSRLGRNGK